MNVRKLTIVLIAFAFAPLAQASGDFSGPVAMQDMTLTHIGELDTVDVEVMTATLQSMHDETLKGAGKVAHAVWFDNEGVEHQRFEGVVSIRVPAKAPEFDTLKGAMNADVRVRFSSDGVAYAECTLAVQPVTSRTFVSFALELIAMGNEVRPMKGVCDVNVLEPGIQVGLPIMHYGDRIAAFVRGKPYFEYEMLDGFCY